MISVFGSRGIKSPFVVGFIIALSPRLIVGVSGVN